MIKVTSVLLVVASIILVSLNIRQVISHPHNSSNINVICESALEGMSSEKLVSGIEWFKTYCENSHQASSMYESLLIKTAFYSGTVAFMLFVLGIALYVRAKNYVPSKNL